jgi:HD-GYP domain-containing protein (c-di-GMP phosphodiesterase class II)
MNDISNEKSYKEIIRAIACLNSAISNMRLYNEDHPQVSRFLNRAYLELKHILRLRSNLTVILVDDELVVDQRPLTAASLQISQFARVMKKNNVERITFSAEVTDKELAQLASEITDIEGATVRSTPGITLGKVRIEEKRLSGDDAKKKLMEWSACLERSQQQIRELFQQIKTTRKIQISGFEAIVAEFIAHMALQANPLQMLASLKSWDEYTYTHAINVCLLTMAQAEAIGIDDHKLHDIGIAAALHDAGKMFVPDYILNKAGKLTEEEWRQMRIHTIRGAMQVLRMDGLPKLAFIGALEHHIRYDGSGYPLLGPWRPTLVSQMIAISDMFDAMRSRRPYQEPKPVDKIIAILKKDSGTAFNPHLVENFISLLEPTPAATPEAKPTSDNSN